MKMVNTSFGIGKCGIPIFLAQDTKTTQMKRPIICNLQADFSKHLAYIAIHNRTINTTERIGCDKPIDQMVELQIQSYIMLN